MNTILDIKNSNDWCFLYVLAAFLHQSKFETLREKEDVNSYKELIQNTFNLTDIKFPIQFNDIQKFMDQNEHLNLSLNIYTVKEDQLQLVFSNVTNEKKPGSENVNQLALFPKVENGENGENGQNDQKRYRQTDREQTGPASPPLCAGNPYPVDGLSSPPTPMELRVKLCIPVPDLWFPMQNLQETYAKAMQKVSGFYAGTPER